ncbi:MAG TPA: ABC transporter ATP-binding protein [Sinomonas sp.]|nr:ABC transporter ATP-binding protein [Sinomonas sp.]
MTPSTETDFELTLSAVRKDFGRGHRKVTAVQPVDLRLDAHSELGVIGESGSGKSTLARMIVGLEHPTSGVISYQGHSVADWLSNRASRLAYRQQVQYVAQDTTSFDPRRTFFESVAVPLRILRGVQSRSGIRERLEAIAEDLSLDPALYSRYPHQVSGGQRQRFALARSLVVEPRLLICDEVVSALDVSVQGAVLNLIKRHVARHRMGLMFVAHGLPAVTFISSELLVMRHGEVVERGAVDRIVKAPQHPYTRELLAAYADSSSPVSNSASSPESSSEQREAAL